jgi:cytoskeletal protein RodZ
MKRLATKMTVSILRQMPRYRYEGGAMMMGSKKREYKSRRAQFSTTWWIATAVAVGWAVTIWQGY